MASPALISARAEEADSILWRSAKRSWLAEAFTYIKKLRNQTSIFSKIHVPIHHERLFHDQHASHGLQSPREGAAGEEGGVLGVEAVVNGGAAGDLVMKRFKN